MSLNEILQHRRAVRKFDPARTLDPDIVSRCLEQAALAPTSSNLQLWEAHHVTDPELLRRIARACFDQQPAATAQQMVVFVARQDKHRAHARACLQQAIDNIRRTSPPDRQENRIRQQTLYYTRIMPFLYARCFGVLGALRQTIGTAVGLFRPMMQDLTEADMRVSVHKSCALVAQTFMLAMSEAGCDTCPLEGYDSRRLRRILNLPCGAEISMAVACGHRLSEGIWGDRLRLPFAEVYRRC